MYDSGTVMSNISDGVILAPNFLLPPLRSLLFRVQSCTLAATLNCSNWSMDSPFHTAPTRTNATAVKPMWPTKASTPLSEPRFVFFRTTFETPACGEAFLSVSAKPTPNWPQAFSGRGNASKLLCAYKAFVNGVPLGAGPGRTMANGVQIDTFNISALTVLRPPPALNVLAVEAFYQPLTPRRNDSDDRGGLWAILTDGTAGNSSGAARGVILSTSNLSMWRHFDADTVYNAAAGCTSKMCAGDFAVRYFQPAEMIDMREYPAAHWRTLEETPSEFESVQLQERPAFADGMAVKRALPVMLRSISPSRFIVREVGAVRGGGSGRAGGTPCASDHHYIIDFGRVFQGGIDITFNRGMDGQSVVVRFAEHMFRNGSLESVVYHQPTGPKTKIVNRWVETWTLADGQQVISTHEYTELRYVEIVGAPEPPKMENVRAWQVYYPFSSEPASRVGTVGAGAGAETRAETRAAPRADAGDETGAEAAPSPARTRSDNANQLTHFNSSNELLNSVWELSKYTTITAPLDFNVDSNTRQRDLCNLDAYLQTIYQGAVAPSSSLQPRRRVAEFFFERAGYTNNQTEFQLAVIAAVFHYTVDSADYSLAAARFDSMAERFAMLPFFDAASGLYRGSGARSVLVDHPPSAEIDVDDDVRAACSGSLCTASNAHILRAHLQLAGLADRLGRARDAQRFRSSASALAASMREKLIIISGGGGNLSAACSPPAPACFRDSAGVNSTTLHATMFAIAAGAVDDGGGGGHGHGQGDAPAAADFLPFLRGRFMRRGEDHGLECSGWAALYLAEAFARIARSAAAAAAGPASASASAPAPTSARPSSSLAAASLARARAGNGNASADAAALLGDMLTGTGTNSWYGMLHRDGNNASMTMEAWARDQGSGTYSHAWTAAPAYIIPRLLMGVAPLPGVDAFRSFTVHPLPSPAVPAAAVTIPSPRGRIAVSFVASFPAAGDTGAAAGRLGRLVELHVAVPGNTQAQVCVPAYLVPAGCGLQVDPGPGAVAGVICDRAGTTVGAGGAMLCCPNALAGGEYDLRVHCSQSHESESE
jgi:hypothetical protein